MSSAPPMKPWIDAIHPYVAGKAKLGDTPVVAKLSSNESPFGPSPHAVAAMQAVVAEGHRYPDPASTELRDALAEKYGLEADAHRLRHRLGRIAPPARQRFRRRWATR